MDQHAVPREKLVIPQEIGVKAEDSNIIRQAAEHPACVFPADNRLPPTPNGVAVLRPDEGIGGWRPAPRWTASPPGCCTPSGGRAVPDRGGTRFAGLRWRSS